MEGDNESEEEEDENMNKKPAARAETVIHNTRNGNKKHKGGPVTMEMTMKANTRKGTRTGRAGKGNRS